MEKSEIKDPYRREVWGLLTRLDERSLTLVKQNEVQSDLLQKHDRTLVGHGEKIQQLESLKWDPTSTPTPAPQDWKSMLVEWAKKSPWIAVAAGAIILALRAWGII